MNERPSIPFSTDPRTGLHTAITSDAVGRQVRDGCAYLNRLRTRSILDSVKVAPSGEQIAADAWAALIARQSTAWHAPPIPLESLGISHDDDGIANCASMQQLRGGLEAQPYCDREAGVVYKLFDLRISGALGRRLILQPTAVEDEFELLHTDAVLKDTLEKICVLTEMGAHPTEIVGLADSSDFLIVKQPQAKAGPYSDGAEGDAQQAVLARDRELAVEAVRGIFCVCRGLREAVAVAVLDDRPWIIGDLHERNIMIDANGNPTIIDALIGTIPFEAFERLASVTDAVRRARYWRKRGVLPQARGLGDGIDDSEL